MAKAIQCPTCARKHRVDALPDAPTFRCEGCGQSLKVPAQFRPSVMASRAVQRPAPDTRHGATSRLPPAGAAAVGGAAGAAAPAPPRRARRSKRQAPPTADTGARPIARPLRLLAWAAALVLGLLVTGWIARVSGWLSGDRLVDAFTGTGGMERYLRILALAPAWALITTLLLSLFLEGGRALARRRNVVRAEREASQREERRAASRPVDAPETEVARDRVGPDGQRRHRDAVRRGAR